MGRRNRRISGSPGEDRPLTAATQRQESHRGEDYTVRSVTGTAAVKPYRCPGCDQVVGVGVPHVVVWPSDALDADDRRHWHTPCWAARDTRAPGVQRSRNAPR